MFKCSWLFTQYRVSISAHPKIWKHLNLVVPRSKSSARCIPRTSGNNIGSQLRLASKYSRRVWNMVVHEKVSVARIEHSSLTLAVQVTSKLRRPIRDLRGCWCGWNQTLYPAVAHGEGKIFPPWPTMSQKLKFSWVYSATFWRALQQTAIKICKPHTENWTGPESFFPLAKILQLGTWNTEGTTHLNWVSSRLDSQTLFSLEFYWDFLKYLWIQSPWFLKWISSLVLQIHCSVYLYIMTKLTENITCPHLGGGQDHSCHAISHFSSYFRSLLSRSTVFHATTMWESLLLFSYWNHCQISRYRATHTLHHIYFVRLLVVSCSEVRSVKNCTRCSKEIQRHPLWLDPSDLIFPTEQYPLQWHLYPRQPNGSGRISESM